MPCYILGMTKRLMPSKDTTDFAQLAKTEPHPRTRMRFLMLHHLQMGLRPNQIAPMLNVNAVTVRKVRQRFLADGIEAVHEAKRSGRPTRLHPDQHEAFRNAIEQAQAQRVGGRLVGEDIGQILKQQFGVEYQLSGIYKLLKTLGIHWISSRSRHPQQDQAAQEAFKKIS